MPTPYSIVWVTAPDEKAARKISRGLLESKLAACVGALPGLESHFWWDGKIDEAKETLLMIKTRTSLIPEVTAFVKENHPYSIPETLAVPIEDGNDDYLTWLGANTQFTRQEPPPESLPPGGSGKPGL